MKQEHIASLERDLEYWIIWTAHEEKILPDCPEDTKPYIINRIAMGARNIKELEKALEVLTNDSSETVADSTPNVAARTSTISGEGQEAKANDASI